MTIPKDLLNFLTTHLNDGAITQAEIAEFCGVSSATINLAFKTERATKTNCRKLLNFSLAYKRKAEKTNKLISTLNSPIA